MLEHALHAPEAASGEHRRLRRRRRLFVDERGGKRARLLGGDWRRQSQAQPDANEDGDKQAGSGEPRERCGAGRVGWAFIVDSFFRLSWKFVNPSAIRAATVVKPGEPLGVATPCRRTDRDSGVPNHDTARAAICYRGAAVCAISCERRRSVCQLSDFLVKVDARVVDRRYSW